MFLDFVHELVAEFILLDVGFGVEAQFVLIHVKTCSKLALIFHVNPFLVNKIVLYQSI